jgi:hypothetical protein
MSKTIMSSIALGLLLVPTTGVAQRIPHELVVHDARLYSELASTRPRFHYRGRFLEVVRRHPRRGLVVTERYRRFAPRVRPLWMSRNEGRRWLRRRGFRPVTLYMKDGRYFRRVWTAPRSRANPSLRPVVVWRRDGMVYRIEDRHLRRPHRDRRRH